MANIDIDGFEIQGIAEMNRRILNIYRASPEETVNAAVKVAKNKVLAPSIELCPILTGDLRRTGRVGEPELNGYDVDVPILYGDEQVDYAGYVHENLEANHPVGQAKFLETAMNNEEPHYVADLAKEIRLERLG